MSQLPTAVLCATNVPTHMTVGDLEEIFKDFNATRIAIASCRSGKHGVQEMYTGHIEFASVIEAETALTALQNHQISTVSSPLLLKLSSQAKMTFIPPAMSKHSSHTRLLTSIYDCILLFGLSIYRILYAVIKSTTCVTARFIHGTNMLVSESLECLYFALCAAMGLERSRLPPKPSAATVSLPLLLHDTDSESIDATAVQDRGPSADVSPTPPVPNNDEKPPDTPNETDALRSEIASLREQLEASSSAADSERAAHEILVTTHLAQVKELESQIKTLQVQHVTLQSVVRGHKAVRTKVTVKLEKELAEKEKELASAEARIQALIAASDILREEKAGLENNLDRANAHCQAVEQACVDLGRDKAEVERALSTAEATIRDQRDAFANLRREKNEEIRIAKDTLQAEVDRCKHDAEIAESKIKVANLDADRRVSEVERKRKDEKQRNDVTVHQLNVELKVAQQHLLQLKAQKKEAEQLHAQQLGAEKRMREKAESDKRQHDEKTKSAKEEAERKAEKERDDERKAHTEGVKKTREDEEIKWKAKELAMRKEEGVLKEQIRCCMKDWGVGWTKERAFARFKILLGEFGETKFSETQPLTIWSVPWPLLVCPTGLSHTSLEWKDVDRFFDFVKGHVKPDEHDMLLEKAVRIFHPDRWRSRNLLDTVSDGDLRVYLEKSGITVSQALNPRSRLLKK